jgi:AraC-like DNA-binding protein
MTERQLERRFNEQIGISPKEFINLTRFRQAFVKIQLGGIPLGGAPPGGAPQNQHKRSLADIAWECGYYDHAHLTNDFKRYAGSAPTELILSDFSKTIALNFE